MSPKTTPNADRPSADRFAVFAGRPMVSPATTDKGPIPAIVGVFHAGSAENLRRVQADVADDFRGHRQENFPSHPGWSASRRSTHALLCARTYQRLPRLWQVEPGERVVVAVPLRPAWWRKAHASGPR